MRIDAITCCVGEAYCEKLLRALPLWRQWCRTVTVVTTLEDKSYRRIAVGRPDGVNVVCRDDALKAHGATFNKGAVLCEAFACANPQEWCLHFDADILPPANWFECCKTAVPGNLYGVKRFTEDGKLIDELPLHPYGYFHLWHTSDRHSWRWPLFETHHPHAGNYDANFADHWPRENRLELGFSVTHMGEPRRNWFGPGADPKHMEAIHKTGLLEERMRSNRGHNRLQLPNPKARITLFAPSDATWRRYATVAMESGPFDVQLEAVQ